MISIDTNILVRFLTQDDKEQCRKIDRFLEKCRKNNEIIYVADLVVIETIWVLESAYGFGKAEVMAAIGRVLLASFLEFEDLSLLLRVQSFYQNGSADFSDYYIQCKAQKAGCMHLFTFDKVFAKSPFCKTL
ncbi:MAG: type II toxin-antitoxin system VapC family toxin [Oligoflexales bacterium]|nr:type II toxin-antitoxin system VapC family toxin [Oligoflexales bacterium]